MIEKVCAWCGGPGGPEMDSFERLAGIIRDAGYKRNEPEAMARILIANGATLKEEKPLEAFLHPVDAYEGLKGKYLVFKADTGEQVVNCFVLRPDKDPAAVDALRAYANATDNKALTDDIYDWVGKKER